MSKPFDVTMKVLLETEPEAWLSFVGLPAGSVELIDADTSTVSASADKVLKINAPQPALVHLEFQSSSDATLADRTLLYSVLLRHRHNLPVASVVILLRKAARHPTLTGQVRCVTPDGRTYLIFEYQIIRVWERPVADLLAGSLATLPLAPISKVTQAELPDVIRQMESRLRVEATPAQAGALWVATFVLMGLRYPQQVGIQLLKGVQGMEDSVTYQYIVAKGMAEGLAKGMAKGIAEGKAEGKAEEARNLILRIGAQRFGAPDDAAKARLQAVASIEQLELLADRLLEVENWNELLA